MRKIRKVLICSAIAVALFTMIFIIMLIFTFNMDEWKGIEHYASIFNPSFLYTVYPSIILAISFLIFNVSVFYYANEDKKIWAHLAMNFGIVYSTISLANYLIQLISIMPSVMNGNLNGIDIFVSGYPNSIFFALMASYFLMCISYFFTALVFENKWIRFWLFLGSAGCVLMFVIGVLTSINVFMMIGAMCWITGTTIGMLMIALKAK